MWQLLAAIFGAVIGFSAGTAGLTQIFPSSPSGENIPVTPYQLKSCYSPESGINLTLKWPDNFTGVSDRRPELNPAFFPSNPTTNDLFNASPDCQNLVLGKEEGAATPRSERTYILVRKDLRTPSCKTDELSGPYGTGVCTGWNTDRNGRPVPDHRGTCTLDQYTDLRKIADLNQDGQIYEIFWNPFSYNVSCNYKQNANCGPGSRQNVNMKDFIYVLKKRDAFDPDTNPRCLSSWDPKQDIEACSHFFDVYLAEDVYENMQTMETPDIEDYDNPNYFLKQVVENCKDESLVVPAPEANLTLPPLFLASPFVWQSDQTQYNLDKIMPENQIEKDNYDSYVWQHPDIFYNPADKLTINLINPGGEPQTLSDFTVCSLTAAQSLITLNTPGIPDGSSFSMASPLDCYDPIGTIRFKDNDITRSYKVYVKITAPQTFILLDWNNNTQGYFYSLTQRNYPANTQYSPALQLTKLEMISQNTWTWATPWCKPAIYLYPEKETEMNVRLNVDGEITVSDPLYGDYGWNVKAYPDGKIELISQNSNLKTITHNSKLTGSIQLPTTNLQTPNVYPYLYYEADVTGVTLPKAGWVVKNSNLKTQISKIMKDIGFNGQEISDFLSYWLPRLTEKPYYFVSLMPEEMINRKETLFFSQTPDTLIRARFVFEGLNLPTFVTPLSIPKHTRSGFTVTDWGGTLVGESCSEVEVK